MAYTIKSKRVRSLTAEYTEAGGWPHEAGPNCTPGGTPWDAPPAEGNAWYNGAFLAMHLNAIKMLVAVWRPGDFAVLSFRAPRWQGGVGLDTPPPPCTVASGDYTCENHNGIVEFYEPWPPGLSPPFENISVYCADFGVIITPEFYCTTVGDDAYKVYIRAHVMLSGANYGCNITWFPEGVHGCGLPVFGGNTRFYKPHIQAVLGTTTPCDSQLPADYYSPWPANKRYFDYLGRFGEEDAFCASLDQWMITGSDGSYRTFDNEDEAGCGEGSVVQNGELFLEHYNVAV